MIALWTANQLIVVRVDFRFCHERWLSHAKSGLFDKSFNYYISAHFNWFFMMMEIIKKKIMSAHQHQRFIRFQSFVYKQLHVQLLTHSIVQWNQLHLLWYSLSFSWVNLTFKWFKTSVLSCFIRRWRSPLRKRMNLMVNSRKSQEIAREGQEVLEEANLEEVGREEAGHRDHLHKEARKIAHHK